MSKWICKCNAINPVLNWVCHNCKREWIIETSPYSNIKTISVSKDDRIEVLEKQNKIIKDALTNRQRLFIKIDNDLTKENTVRSYAYFHFALEHIDNARKEIEGIK